MTAYIKPKFSTFLSAIATNTYPTFFKEAVKDPKGCTTMNDELEALERNDVGEIDTLPASTKAIDCKWSLSNGTPLSFPCSSSVRPSLYIDNALILSH